MNIVRNDFVLYFFPNFMSGSTRRITRNAVGTENIALTLCSSMILRIQIYYLFVILLKCFIICFVNYT